MSKTDHWRIITVKNGFPKRQSNFQLRVIHQTKRLSKPAYDRLWKIQERTDRQLVFLLNKPKECRLYFMPTLLNWESWIFGEIQFRFWASLAPITDSSVILGRVALKTSHGNEMQFDLTIEHWRLSIKSRLWAQENRTWSHHLHTKELFRNKSRHAENTSFYCVFF